MELLRVTNPKAVTKEEELTENLDGWDQPGQVQCWMAWLDALDPNPANRIGTRMATTTTIINNAYDTTSSSQKQYKHMQKTLPTNYINSTHWEKIW